MAMAVSEITGMVVATAVIILIGKVVTQVFKVFVCVYCVG